MTIFHELRSLEPIPAGAAELQVRRAIGFLKSANQHASDLPSGQQCAFLEDVERMCADLNLWLEAMKSKEIH